MLIAQLKIGLDLMSKDWPQSNEESVSVSRSPLNRDVVALFVSRRHTSTGGQRTRTNVGLLFLQ